MSSPNIPASSSVLDLPECTSAPSGSRPRTAALAPSASATMKTSKFRSSSLAASASSCVSSAGTAYLAARSSTITNSPFRIFICCCGYETVLAGAQAARPLRPQRADDKDTRPSGQGDDDGHGDVLSRDPPQCEPQALGEHEA